MEVGEGAGEEQPWKGPCQSPGRDRETRHRRTRPQEDSGTAGETARWEKRLEEPEPGAREGHAEWRTDGPSGGNLSVTGQGRPSWGTFLGTWQ